MIKLITQPHYLTTTSTRRQMRLNKFIVSRDVTEKCTHYEKVATSCLIFFQTNQNV